METEQQQQERIKREKDFHNDRFGTEDHVREPTAKYYSVMRPVKERYKKIIAESCEGKKVLEYGCATGGTTFSWARRGAKVFGIDISEEAVKKAKQAAAKENLDVDFAVMNAEDLQFSNQSFDMIVGTGILHHLNLDRSYSELSRCLNQDGFALFIEPMGHNPLINFYRWLTPKMRTDDEHPFKTNDINLAKQYFEKVDVEYYNLLSISSIVFRNWKSYPSILAFANRIDQMLFSILPFTKRWAWMVILKLSLPNQNETKNGSKKTLVGEKTTSNQH
jgi:2-polyprenyl-3-methyl-5-hydroxy-6-metoxy-1,4-benzoquinol methylase